MHSQKEQMCIRDRSEGAHLFGNASKDIIILILQPELLNEWRVLMRFSLLVYHLWYTTD